MRELAYPFVARARIEGAAGGPLAGVDFAVKDLIDVAGLPTAGGNPDWAATHPDVAAAHAPAVARLLAAGARCVGKVHTDELSRGLFGENAHHGVLDNPRAPGRLPGGSSSGSAVAVARGEAALALGTDTGGSVRVPASFCGVYGMRPTLGRVPMHGVIAQAPGFDTVGWLAHDGALLARAGRVLLGEPPRAPGSIRLVVAQDLLDAADADARDAFEQALPRLAAQASHMRRRPLAEPDLDAWLAAQVPWQSREAWLGFADWIDRTNARFGFEVAASFAAGAQAASDAIETGRAARLDALARVSGWLGDDVVVAFPTTPFAAPVRGQGRAAMWALRTRALRHTVAAGLLGAPQASLPLARIGPLPLGVSILAAPGHDALLLDLAERLEYDGGE